jgi:hypothetical protein
MVPILNQIVVTKQEYYAIMFVCIQMGLFYTMNVLFMAPHERVTDEEVDSDH